MFLETPRQDVLSFHNLARRTTGLKRHLFGQYPSDFSFEITLTVCKSVQITLLPLISLHLELKTKVLCGL